MKKTNAKDGKTKAAKNAGTNRKVSGPGSDVETPLSADVEIDDPNKRSAQPASEKGSKTSAAAAPKKSDASGPKKVITKRTTEKTIEEIHGTGSTAGKLGTKPSEASERINEIANGPAKAAAAERRLEAARARRREEALERQISAAQPVIVDLAEARRQAEAERERAAEALKTIPPTQTGGPGGQPPATNQPAAASDDPKPKKKLPAFKLFLIVTVVVIIGIALFILSAFDFDKAPKPAVTMTSEEKAAKELSEKNERENAALDTAKKSGFPGTIVTPPYAIPNLAIPSITAPVPPLPANCMIIAGTSNNSAPGTGNINIGGNQVIIINPASEGTHSSGSARNTTWADASRPTRYIEIRKKDCSKNSLREWSEPITSGDDVQITIDQECHINWKPEVVDRTFEICMHREGGQYENWTVEGDRAGIWSDGVDHVRIRLKKGYSSESIRLRASRD